MYCLWNNDKNKNLDMFSTDAITVGLTTYSTHQQLFKYFPNIFDLWLVESTDVKLMDTEG